MPDLILLRWFDSTVADATAVYDDDDIEAEHLIVLETVGWHLGLKEDAYGGHYVVAASRHGEKDYRGVQLIPKANVIALSRLLQEQDTKLQKEVKP